MNSPADEATQARMLAAHEEAAKRLGLTCSGPPAWGYLGRTIGRRAGHLWLRVASTAKANASRKNGEGVAGAADLAPSDVPRPRLHDVYDWIDGGYAYQAEVTDYVAEPVISPGRLDLAHDPELPDAWWASLRTAIDQLAQVDAGRIVVRDAWMTRAFPKFLGIPAPNRIERVTGHADLHWANLTAPRLVILDWERWGRAPIGYDPGLLHISSLLVPHVTERVRHEFATVLNTPAGRIGELAALAEMLQAVARGWYAELAPLLANRATELTGVRPPVVTSPELGDRPHTPAQSGG